jgi:hypothetical protein
MIVKLNITLSLTRYNRRRIAPIALGLIWAIYCAAFWAGPAEGDHLADRQDLTTRRRAFSRNQLAIVENVYEPHTAVVAIKPTPILTH